MPRGERPLDAGDGPLLRFATDLRRLRKQAGNPTYRLLAERTHYSVTTLSDAAAGRRLPSLPVTLAYVRACNGDPEAWEARWRAVAAELAAAAPAERAKGGEAPPYVGLAAFQTADADRFFGRERLADELVGRLAKGRFVAVFGASGAGKSSLLRAGLIPRWPADVLLLTPGPHPLRELAVLDGRSPETELLVVVDQFEEAFTLCRDPAERATFVAALLAAARDPDRRCHVVLGVRADFYPHCTAIPDLAEALTDAQVAVGPMTVDELRRAVTEPAVRGGYTLEGALLATLVADAHGRVGALPLLSHALLETWRRRRGNTLTLAGYQATGGIDGALAHTAETVYDALDPAQRRLVRHLFLRLTAPGDGTEDTKRRIPRAELDGAGTDTALVLHRLTEARLVTADRDSVEVVHESLIRCWPRLHQWLADARDGLRLHRRLTEAAAQWHALDRDPGALYRSTQLALAETWAAGEDRGLTPREREFLGASLAAHAAGQAADRRRTRRLRQLVALLSVLSVLAGAATAVAVRAQRAASHQRDIAMSQRVAERATAMRGTSPALAAQLSLAAYRLAPTAEARGSLLSTFGAPYAAQLHGDESVDAVAFSGDGRRLATGGPDQTVRLWDTTDPHHPRQLATLAGTGAVKALAFDAGGRTLAVAGPDGRTRLWEVGGSAGPRTTVDTPHPAAMAAGPHTLAAAGADGAVHTWEVSRPGTATRLRLGPGVVAVALSRDGRIAATAGADGREVRLWEVTDPDRPLPLGTLTGHTDEVRALAFSHDGRTLASGGVDASVRLWNVADPRHPHALTVLRGHIAAVNGLAFAPDGRTLASASADHTTRLWEVPGPRVAEHGDSVYAVDFSHDQRRLATGSYDRTIRLWDVADPRRPRVLTVLRGHDGPVNAVAFHSRTGVLASAGNDRTVRLWDAAGGPLARIDHPDSVESLAYAPDGDTLATAGHDGVVRLWDVTDPRRPAPLASAAGHTGSVDAVAFDPGGRLLATGGADRTARLWDVADRRHPRAVAVLTGHADTVKTVAFRPDGQVLATGGEDRAARLWDVRRPSSPSMLATLTGYTDGVKAVRFAPDGERLGTASSDRLVRLWDVGDPSHPAPLATLTGHGAPVDALAFAPDGYTVASGGEDAVALLWDVDVERVASRVCAVTAGLGRADWETYFPGVDYAPPCADG